MKFPHEFGHLAQISGLDFLLVFGEALPWTGSNQQGNILTFSLKDIMKLT